MTTTPAQIKRYIGGKDTLLILVEHDGTLWATNRYWAIPAARITPFLDEHGIGLTAEAAGTYSLNGGLTHIDDRVPASKLAARILDPARYTVPLKPATIGGFDAYTFCDGHRCALFTRGRQQAVPVRADWLEWITIDGLSPALRYATAKKRTSPAAVFDGDALLGVVMPLRRGNPPADLPAPPPPVLQAVTS